MGFADKRKGIVVLLLTGSLAILFGLLALVVDLGLAYFQRESAQSAADAAALSAATWAIANGGACGSSGISCPSSTYTCPTPLPSSASDELQAGCLYANSNGFTTGGNGGRQTVSMNAGTGTPPGVSGNTPTMWVEAAVSDSGPALFGRMFGLSGLSTSVVSIAGIATSPPSSCVYSLDPTASGAISAKGNVTVTSSCGLYVNSSNSSGLIVSGGATVTATQIMVNGGYSLSSNSSVSPTPTSNAGSITDPLASHVEPTPGTCMSYSLPNQGSVTLNPGTYCGGISVSGQTVITFNPGTYIINGGGLNVSGGATLQGTGVTFYNTGTSSTIAPISLSGNTTVNLSAPTSGTYTGMLFIQDRTLTYSGSNSFSGTSGSVYQGTLYFPTTAVSYSGTSTSTGTYTAIIADMVSFTGNTRFANDPSGTYTGLATKSAALIR